MRNYSLGQNIRITTVDLTSCADSDGCTYPLSPIAIQVLVGLLLGNVAWMPITLYPRRSCQVAISMPVGAYIWLSVATGVGYGKLLLVPLQLITHFSHLQH
jgi:hypothetical protein